MKTKSRNRKLDYFFD